MQVTCFECQAVVEADELEALGEAFRAHARSTHDWPYDDQSICNYAEATQRLTGPWERLEEIGAIEVHPVTEDRIPDYQAFFDHDAFVGQPEWAACYCIEPHVRDPVAPSEGDEPHWRANREGMSQRLKDGRAHGYLAYVDGRPAGWVNASNRADYTLYKMIDSEGPAPDAVIGVSCFIIAPAYRRHGIASALLDRVIVDAAARGADWIEGYPFNKEREGDAGNFRGPRSMYDQRGFQPVEVLERYTVMRRQT